MHWALDLLPLVDVEIRQSGFGLLVFVQGYVSRVCFRSLLDLTLLSA